MGEIVADVFTWAWFSEPHGYDFNGHLLRHAERNLCIDPVQPTDACLAEIVRMGTMKILLTNRNHSRGCQSGARPHGRQDAHSPGRRRAC
jgi:hypothetical protein